MPSKNKRFAEFARVVALALSWRRAPSHAFLGLLSMWVLTVAWTVQNGSGSGRIWTVYGPGAP